MATKEQIIAQRSISTERYILSTMPVLYLPLGKTDSGKSGDSFISSDGHGHTCTATSTPWTLRGRDFDGASGLLTVSDATSIQNIFDDGGTIEVWCCRFGQSNHRTIYIYDCIICGGTAIIG